MYARSIISHDAPVAKPDKPQQEHSASLVDALFGALKGELGDVEPSTFVVLDAAINTFLPEILEAQCDTFRSLYSGEAEQELSDTAPWLVQLKPDDQILKCLFAQSSAPWHFRGNGLGVIFRATATFDQMRNHLRKFLKIRKASNAWYFFRFWEPQTAVAYFAGLADESPEHNAWARIDDVKRVMSVLIPDEASLHEVRFSPVLDGTKPGSFRLTQADVDRMGQVTRWSALAALAGLGVQHGDPVPAGKESEVQPGIIFAELVRDRAVVLGLTSRTDHERLIRLSRLFGLNFYDDPRLGCEELTHVQGASEKMYAILDRRDPLADMIVGEAGEGGLARAFLETDGSWFAFQQCLRCQISETNAASFYSHASAIPGSAPLVDKVWHAFYRGHAVRDDPRHQHVCGNATTDESQTVEFAAWVIDALADEPLARAV